jgi:hypothetical protein
MYIFMHVWEGRISCFDHCLYGLGMYMYVCIQVTTHDLKCEIYMESLTSRNDGNK